jgi:chaperonin cofactor prefoldin
MELEKFEKAKKVKEDLDRLETQKSKLEYALKSCSLGATIAYSKGGEFRSKGEVNIYNAGTIKEMLSKELDRLNGQIELVKKEFENI